MGSRDMNFMFMEIMMKKYGILEVLVLGLGSSISADMTIFILNSIYHIINLYDAVFTGSVNKAIDMLERMYNFSCLLAKVEQ